MSCLKRKRRNIGKRAVRFEEGWKSGTRQEYKKAVGRGLGYGRKDKVGRVKMRRGGWNRGNSLEE